MGSQVRVLHEEATHEIVLVAYAVLLDVPRGQQKPRILDTACGQDIHASRHTEAGPSQALRLDPRDRATGRLEVDAQRVGV